MKVDKLMKDLESLSMKLSCHALFGFHHDHGKVEEPPNACTRNKNDSSAATSVTSQGKTKLLLEEFVLLRSGSHAFCSVQMSSEFLDKKHELFLLLNRNDFVFVPVVALPRNENNLSSCQSAGSEEDKDLLEIFEKGDGLQLEFPSVGDDDKKEAVEVKFKDLFSGSCELWVADSTQFAVRKVSKLFKSVSKNGAIESELMLAKAFPVICQFADEVWFDMGAMLFVSKEIQVLLEKSKNATLRSKLQESA